MIKNEDNNPLRMNRAKSLAVRAEQRLREVATWDLTHGNREKTSPDEIFAKACEFRHQIDIGMWSSLDELETVVFGRWGLNVKPEPMVLEFMEEEPQRLGFFSRIIHCFRRMVK